MTVFCEPDPATKACVKCGRKPWKGQAPACPKSPNIVEPTGLEDLATGEPYFILRAQDLWADNLVEQWASRAQARGTDPRKVDAALRVAAAMRSWTPRSYPE